jgi:hypothetical protein
VTSLMQLAISPIREAVPAEMAMRITAFERSTAMVFLDLIAEAVVIMASTVAEEIVSYPLDEDRRLSYRQWVEINHYEFVRSLNNG